MPEPRPCIDSFQRFDYTFDAADRRTAVTHVGESLTTFAYDAADQLLGEFEGDVGLGWEELTLDEWETLDEDGWNALELNSSTSAGGTRTYSYDPVGNRLLKDVDGEVTTYAYDDANRLQTAEDASGTTSYAYDADGNQTRIEEPLGDLTTSTWDAENHLVLVERPDATVTTLTYGPVTKLADVKRVSKEDALGTLVNRWDADNVVQQTDELGTLEVEYVLAPAPQPQGDLVSQHRDLETSFYHFDGRGNTIALTDAAGVETDAYEYDAWGNVVTETGTTENDCLYMGLWQVFVDDAQGAMNPIYAARDNWLNPRNGRWLSEDAIRADEENLYRYAGNDPVNRVDPSGLQDFWLVKDRLYWDGPDGRLRVNNGWGIISPDLPIGDVPDFDPRSLKGAEARIVYNPGGGGGGMLLTRTLPLAKVTGLVKESWAEKIRPAPGLQPKKVQDWGIVDWFRWANEEGGRDELADALPPPGVIKPELPAPPPERVRRKVQEEMCSPEAVAACLPDGRSIAELLGEVVKAVDEAGASGDAQPLLCALHALFTALDEYDLGGELGEEVLLTAREATLFLATVLPRNAGGIALDAVDLVATVLGLIPAAGVVPDVLGLIVAAIRRDPLGVGLSIVAIVPVLGWLGGAGKVARLLKKLRTSAKSLTGPSKRAMIAFAKLFEEFWEKLKLLAKDESGTYEGFLESVARLLRWLRKKLDELRENFRKGADTDTPGQAKPKAEEPEAAPKQKPDPRTPPRPVTLANPGRISAADYAQLKGLSFEDKVRQMRGILREAQKTRTAEQVEKLGPFRWQEAVSPRGDVLFIGQGAPATTSIPTVTIITRKGTVYRMRPAGLAKPKSGTVDFDLVAGKADKMVE